jgi:predicted enzyme related to lactoylglutathione lyase
MSDTPKEDQMPEASSRGRFVWHDLMTTDPEAAKAFYTTVTGWGTQVWDGPMPYTMWTANEVPMGGIMQLPPEATAGGAPPHWLAYVSVPDVDATLARAQELGGKTLVPAQDIPTVGRFAVIADPQGAVLALFKSEKEAPEPEGRPVVGDFSWHELITTDHKAAFDFYSDLFGWEKTAAHDMGPMGIYQLYGRNGQDLGGMFDKTADMPQPPSWNHYIRVEDVDAAAGKITENGGKVIIGPMDVPGGDRIVMGMDPQGGMFALHQVIGSAQ